jgi:hypothetical protein
MRRFMCLRYYAEAKVLRCSHLSKALALSIQSSNVRVRIVKYNVALILAEKGTLGGM